MFELVDTGELIIMALLAGLAIFILWESFKRERPASRSTSTVPGQTATELGLLIGAGVVAVMGVLALLDHTDPRQSGRYAFFWNALVDTFGQVGIAVTLWITAALTLCVWHARRQARLSSPQRQTQSGR